MTHAASRVRQGTTLYALRFTLSSPRLCGEPLLRFVPLCLCAFVPLLTGCVERRISITSEPTGALVWVNDVEVGRTPTELNFKHYGQYDVRLELEGHDTLQTVGDAKTPWWDFPGPDLVAEAIPNAKKTIRWHYALTPTLSTTMPRDQFESSLIDRAHSMRDQLGPAPAPIPAAESDAATDSAAPQSVDVPPASDGKADDGLKPADAANDDSARPDR